MGAGVEVVDLRVSFGDVEAVQGISFHVGAGRALALLGRNGAGKSTTMRVLAGVVPLSSGRVSVAGHDLPNDLIAVKRAVGFCPDVGGMAPRATPWELLQLSARLRRLPPGWEERGRDLLDRFELAGASNRVTAGFSHGMGRRLAVVLAALHEPSVLLLDEPFDGVDPAGVDATMQVIREALARGATVLISTHLRELATEACDDAVVLRGGSAVSTSPAVDLAGAAGAERYRQLLR